MINCIIVDDDPVPVNLIRHFVSNTEGLHVLAEFNNGMEASKYIRKNGPSINLIFLDIEMPEMSGTELLESFKDLPPVIVISSEEKYAVKAFEHKVLHYLVKPLDYGKFLNAVERVFELSGNSKEQLLDYIIVKDDGMFRKLDYKDIVYFEALGDYVKVHTKGKVYVVNTTMKKLLEKVVNNLQFIRIHRSYIINLVYLEHFDAQVAVVSQKFIPIGEKFKADLQTRLNIL